MNSSKEIWQEIRQLEKLRRDKIKEVMDKWDRDFYYPKMKELQNECSHNWNFVGLNPINYPVFTCTICRKTEIRPDAS